MQLSEIVKAIIYEWTSVSTAERIPEPLLIMEDKEQVQAYSDATKPDGIMSPLYLLFAISSSEVIRPGDVVLDLGSGAGNHLIHLARLNPDIEIIATDLSDEMIEVAQENIKRAGVTNVSFRKMDMTDMKSIAPKSIDAVISSLALHHLPNTQALDCTMTEIARVLKPDGGICLLDFQHMRSKKTIELFSHQYEKVTHEIVVQDYYNSLLAAFSKQEIKNSLQLIRGELTFHFMSILPFLFISRTKMRRKIPLHMATQFQTLYKGMPKEGKKDFDDLIFLLGLKKTKKELQLTA